MDPIARILLVQNQKIPPGNRLKRSDIIKRLKLNSIDLYEVSSPVRFCNRGRLLYPNQYDPIPTFAILNVPGIKMKNLIAFGKRQLNAAVFWCIQQGGKVFYPRAIFFRDIQADEKSEVVMSDVTKDLKKFAEDGVAQFSFSRDSLIKRLLKLFQFHQINIKNIYHL